MHQNPPNVPEILDYIFGDFKAEESDKKKIMFDFLQKSPEYLHLTYWLMQLVTAERHTRESLEGYIQQGRIDDVLKIAQMIQENKAVVHGLYNRYPLCGFSKKVPGQWPVHHRWESIGDPKKEKDINCPLCKHHLCD